MANPHKLWMAIGTFGALTGVFELLRKKPAQINDNGEIDVPDESEEPSEPSEQEIAEVDTRDRIVAWAESHEGSQDNLRFWDEAMNGQPGPYPKDWCGAFVLAGLHHGGLALDRTWAIGKGLEATLPKLVRTNDPKPGDIAYFTAKQHVAIVLHVDGSEVTLANGNSTGNRVVINVKPKSAVTQFYSIERYLTEENEPLTEEIEV